MTSRDCVEKVLTSIENTSKPLDDSDTQQTKPSLKRTKNDRKQEQKKYKIDQPSRSSSSTLRVTSTVNNENHTATPHLLSSTLIPTTSETSDSLVCKPQIVNMSSAEPTAAVDAKALYKKRQDLFSNAIPGVFNVETVGPFVYEFMQQATRLIDIEYDFAPFSKQKLENAQLMKNILQSSGTYLPMYFGPRTHDGKEVLVGVKPGKTSGVERGIHRRLRYNIINDTEDDIILKTEYVKIVCVLRSNHANCRVRELVAGEGEAMLFYAYMYQLQRESHFRSWLQPAPFILFNTKGMTVSKNHDHFLSARIAATLAANNSDGFITPIPRAETGITCIPNWARRSSKDKLKESIHHLILVVKAFKQIRYGFFSNDMLTREKICSFISVLAKHKLDITISSTDVALDYHRLDHYLWDHQLQRIERSALHVKRNYFWLKAIEGSINIETLNDIRNTFSSANGYTLAHDFSKFAVLFDNYETIDECIAACAVTELDLSNTEQPIVFKETRDLFAVVAKNREALLTTLNRSAALRDSFTQKLAEFKRKFNN